MTGFNTSKASHSFAVHTTQYLLDFCKKYKSYYGKDGGVTLSGGEPLLQAKAILPLIEALKQENIHTCLDTSGALPLNDDIKNVLNQIDLVLLDIKHTDNDAHIKLTSQSLANTLAILDYLKRIKKPFVIRQVIVPGYTDSSEQVKQLKILSQGAIKIELLPYHAMGVHKWEKLGLEYALKDIAPPSKELMDKLRAIVE